MSSKAQEILAWLEKNRRPEIRVHYQISQGNLPIGASKIGGCPDVPSDFVWPYVTGGGIYEDTPTTIDDADRQMIADVFSPHKMLGAKTKEEFRATQWAMLEAKQKLIDPSFQLPQGEKLQQFEAGIEKMWQEMQPLQKMFSQMLDDMNDEEDDENEDEESDSEDEERANSPHPLTFMAQLNLAELADCDTENLLPKSGLLSFFYDYESGDGGDNQQCAKVFYFSPETPLVRMPLPLDRQKDCEDEYIDIGELAVSFSRQSFVPSMYYAEEQFPDIDVWHEFLDTVEYEQLFGEARECCSIKLFGWAETMQPDVMEEECQLRAMGLNPYDYPNDPKIETEVNRHKDDWILLFQLDSAPNTDLIFGEYGRLYFWIRKEDLVAKRFDKVIHIVQS
ncbi:MAG: DUF1963 domain-containing protein [Neisseriaceae bacterium]|nr:DUF1963 domain-containing protein [Neisseriaceae bacterium]